MIDCGPHAEEHALANWFIQGNQSAWDIEGAPSNQLLVVWEESWWMQRPIISAATIRLPREIGELKHSFAAPLFFGNNWECTVDHSIRSYRLFLHVDGLQPPEKDRAHRAQVCFVSDEPKITDWPTFGDVSVFQHDVRTNDGRWGGLGIAVDFTKVKCQHHFPELFVQITHNVLVLRAGSK